MATSVDSRLLTPAEYLRIERGNPFKSEFHRGEMYEMPGASREHNLITINIGAELRQAVRGRGCEAYVNDMRVYIPAAELYTYPDAIVACDGPRFLDAEVDTLLNPTVLIEVLSPSTEAYDRGWKAEQYRGLPSLREYLLVSQDRAHVEQYVRDGDHWSYREFGSLADTLRIESIGAAIPMAEIYHGVAFPETKPTPKPTARPGPPTP